MGDAQLLVSLVSSYRHDRGFVELNIATSDAAKLHEAIEKKKLDNDDVVWILATRNFFHIYICYLYNNIHVIYAISYITYLKKFPTLYICKFNFS